MAKKHKAAKSKKRNSAQKASVGAQILKAQQDEAEPTNTPQALKKLLQSDTTTAPTHVMAKTPKTTDKTSQSTSVLMSLRVDKHLRDAFNACCKEQDVTGSQLIRKYMREVVKEHRDYREGSHAPL